MFEHKSQPLLPKRAFILRLVRSAFTATLLVIVSLAVGIVGYHALEGLSWLDAFLNASMLLGGMGPVNMPTTAAGKMFAGLYALYCGLVLIATVGIVLAPMAHRMLHRFHLEQEK